MKNMEQLVINICASSDSFGAYSVNCDGIWAAGDTIDECKADVARAIEAIKANLPEDRWPAPIRGEYTIVWHYDTQSLLLQLSRFMTMAGLERMTGINQKQLWAYMHGRSKPRQAQKGKIEAALHRFGSEMEAIAIV